MFEIIIKDTLTGEEQVIVCQGYALGAVYNSNDYDAEIGVSIGDINIPEAEAICSQIIDDIYNMAEQDFDSWLNEYDDEE